MPNFARFVGYGGVEMDVDVDRVGSYWIHEITEEGKAESRIAMKIGGDPVVILDRGYTLDRVFALLQRAARGEHPAVDPVDRSASAGADGRLVRCPTCGDRMPHGSVGRSGQCAACVIAEAEALATVERMKVQEELARAEEEEPVPEFARHLSGWDVVTCEGCGGLAQKHAVTKRLCSACVEVRKPGSQRVEVSAERCPKVWAVVERMVHATSSGDVDALAVDLFEAWEEEVGPIPDQEG